MPLSERVQQIEASKSITLSVLVETLKRDGFDVLGLNVGELPNPTPDFIGKAINDAMISGRTRYGHIQGELVLRQSLALKVQEFNKIKAGPEHVFIGNGSKQILYNIFQVLLNPGDEVIIPIPYWVSFPQAVTLAGGKPIFVSCKENMELDVSLVKKAITAKTKIIIVNSPNNPTGKVYSKKTLEEVLDLCLKHKIYLVSDEAYEYLTFGKSKHVSVASLHPKAMDYVLSVYSFSKTYCMTGLRVGYLVANESIIAAMNRLQGHLCGNICTPVQFGALAALESGQKFVKDIQSNLENLASLVFDLYSTIFPKMQAPEGAFYLFPNVTEFLGRGFPTDQALAEFILREAGVALLPGSAFGMPGHLRISFASSELIINKSYKQIKKVL